MVKRTSTYKELLLFVIENRMYWLAPIILVLLALTLVMAVGTFGGGAAAPFIYTLF